MRIEDWSCLITRASVLRRGVSFLSLPVTLAAVFILLLLHSYSVVAGAFTATAVVPAWIEKQEHNGIVYLLDAATPAIDRYDLNAEQVLPSISLASLTATPTDLAVDDSGIYLAVGQSVLRMGHDGLGQSVFLTTTGSVRDIAVLPDILVVTHSSHPNQQRTFVTYSTAPGNAGVMLDQASRYMEKLEASGSVVYGPSVGLSPSDIFGQKIEPDGSINSQRFDSPFHGDLPRSLGAKLSPDESLVFDYNGVVYAAADLSYVNALGGEFDDITFTASLPVLLRDDALVLYDSDFVETGYFHYSNPVSHISGLRKGQSGPVYR